MDVGYALTQSDADRIERLETFVAMVFRSVDGGGRVVTFDDDDVAEMEQILGIEKSE